MLPLVPSFLYPGIRKKPTAEEREKIRWEIDKAVAIKKKKTLPFKDPKQCPCGHKHLSWGPGDERVYCWDCNRNYPHSECFGSGAVRPLSKDSEKQLPLFKEEELD
ncbi:MAG: hypothetical protein PVH34_12800 [Syntrophobacterales bacterium]